MTIVLEQNAKTWIVRSDAANRRKWNCLFNESSSVRTVSMRINVAQGGPFRSTEQDNVYVTMLLCIIKIDATLVVHYA